MGKEDEKTFVSGVIIRRFQQFQMGFFIWNRETLGRVGPFQRSTSSSISLRFYIRKIRFWYLILCTTTTEKW